MKELFYTCIGPGKDQCGEQHHTLAIAARCLERDDQDWRVNGGHTRRHLVAFEGRVQRLLNEDEFEYAETMRD